MLAYPLIFRFSSVVVNDRFLARVRGAGRAIALTEDNEWVCAGVQPSGLVESGESPVSAYLVFRKTLGGILEELADDSDSVHAFAEKVSDLFRKSDAIDSERWKEAVELLRRRELRLGHGVEKLPQMKAESQPWVEIEGAGDYLEQTEELMLAAPEVDKKAA
jgi:hypothetical protein